MYLRPQLILGFKSRIGIKRSFQANTEQRMKVAIGLRRCPLHKLPQCYANRVRFALDALPLHEELQIPLKLRRDIEIELLHSAIIQARAVSQTIGSPCLCSTDSTSSFISLDAS